MRMSVRYGGQALAGSCDTLGGVDGPPTGARPRRSESGEERRIGDYKIGAGQEQARVRQSLDSLAEQDRCYTSPVNMRKALAGGARWAGREFVFLSGGGNMAVVMGDVRRPSPRPRCRGGGHSTG